MSEDEKDIVPDDDTTQSLFSQAAAVAGNRIDYTLSRLSLIALEAKVAATSFAWMLVMAIFAIIVVCSLWALANFAIILWLNESFAWSTLQITGIVALVNLLLLIVLAVKIKSLSNALLFQHSLQMKEDQEGEL